MNQCAFRHSFTPALKHKSATRLGDSTYYWNHICNEEFEPGALNRASAVALYSLQKKPPDYAPQSRGMRCSSLPIFGELMYNTAKAPRRQQNHSRRLPAAVATFVWN